ncbi:hypothetical protein Ddc_17727 [Ditylenchus destructor]|nr:hypothetical protein Ddc_17727 [Ditylenchus destructor]
MPLGTYELFRGFVSANSRPSAARKEFSCFSMALSVPTRGLRPLERSFHAFPWLCQCQLAAFGRSKGVFMLFRGFVSANSRPSAARKEFSCFSVALSVPTRGLRPLERSFHAFQCFVSLTLCTISDFVYYCTPKNDLPGKKPSQTELL